MRKSLKLAIAVLGVSSLFMASQAQAVEVTLQLSGAGTAQPGCGNQGLYLGPNFTNCTSIPSRSWTWSGVQMTIESNGNAMISGDMTRNSNNEVWGFNISLTDIEYRQSGGGFNYIDGMAFNGPVTEANFIDLANGGDPLGGGSGGSGFGFEWRTVSMTVTPPTPGLPSAWVGYPMPNGSGANRHPLSAELHSRGGGPLYFHAWYQRFDGGTRVGVGDSKALATIIPTTDPGTDPIPEPSTILLFGSGLAGLGLWRLKKGKQA